MRVCQSQSPDWFHSPFPPWYPYVFFLYTCFYFYFVNKVVYQFFQVPHKCVNIWYLLFSFWLPSVCMTVSRSIHVSTEMTQLCSFVWLRIISLYKYTTPSLSILQLELRHSEVRHSDSLLGPSCLSLSLPLVWDHSEEEEISDTQCVHSTSTSWAAWIHRALFKTLGIQQWTKHGAPLLVPGGWSCGENEGSVRQKSHLPYPQGIWLS